MIVQIYEIQTAEEAAECIALGVDHIGSVLLSEDKGHDRAVKEVIELTAGTEVRNSLIPLFHREEALYKALDYYRPHFVHFCESLLDAEGRTANPGAAAELQDKLRVRFPEIRIIRSIPIPTPGAAPAFPFLSLARALVPVTDLFLIDTWLGREPVEGYVGITGRPADWSRARDLVVQSRIPVILAGGLSPENVYEALMRVGPYGADSCTLTNMLDPEGRPVRFRKDFAKVKRFVHEVRRAEKALASSPADQIPLDPPLGKGDD